MRRTFTYICTSLLFALGLTGCMPEIPVTSTITLEGEGATVLVNKELYGLSFEEINHAIEGGLYAERIQNRSFEDGIPPLHCAYNPTTRSFVTPNGLSVPFIRPDSIPGWRALSPNTFLYLETQELINDRNRRALLVAVHPTAEAKRGGAVAEGYGGISIRKGERYRLSFYLKGATISPRTVRVALEDSLLTLPLSESKAFSTTNVWTKHQHTFTATHDAPHARLTLAADSAAMFWIDVVSLFPEKSWKGHANGLNPELMELVEALQPRFIRFPGGSFAEGYTAGTYPTWHESIGRIEERRHFWGLWGYGSSNGMGFHEYLQLCEALNAQPIYVVNSGVTSQSRRPRYEDITAMDKLVQEALDAIAYANEPADSTLGALRAKQGHPAPFNLKHIEIGSENYGQEYTKRFDLFRKAIKAAHPEVTVISSSPLPKRNREDWADSHIQSVEDFFIANHNRYETDKEYRRLPPLFVGEFGTERASPIGNLRQAVAEACFLIGVERAPDVVKRIAFAPLFTHARFACNRPAMVQFDSRGQVLSPSYHLFRLFAANRGDELIDTRVQTYHRPQISVGRVGVDLFDNAFEFSNVSLNSHPVTNAVVRTGGWKVGSGTLTPDANRWNYLLLGDSTTHDYQLTATLKRTKGSGQVLFRLRDNGLSDGQQRYIGFTLGAGQCELFQQSGHVKDALAAAKPLALENNRSYHLRLVCQKEQVSCYLDDVLIHQVSLAPLPSLVSVATIDREQNCILLKVVNTTHHEEKTELRLNGLNISNSAEVIELSGLPETANSFEQPTAIQPVERHIAFPIGGGYIYNFPPNSITLLRLPLE